MSRLARIFSFAGVATLAIAGQALAHAHLKSSVPADKASVASPSELDLTFSEGVNLKFSGIKVTGPKKEEVKLGNAMLMDSDTTLMVPVSDTLEPGTYKVEWHALSNDGHKTNGSYNFTVKP
jgi:methionine-rich copper-binding protein CopC